jgi:Zn ribbon nucleic-acid-binding protein
MGENHKKKQMDYQNNRRINKGCPKCDNIVFICSNGAGEITCLKCGYKYPARRETDKEVKTVAEVQRIWG